MYSISSIDIISLEQANKVQIPLQYASLVDIELVNNARGLLDYRLQNLAINVKKGKVLPYKPLYNFLVAKLEVLQKYITNYLKQR